MSFDGKPHNDARLIAPYLHHPKAPAVGVLLADALDIAYMASGGLSGGQVFDQYYPVTWRSISQARERSVVSGTSYIRLAEGFRFIPDQATHIYCEAIFSSLNAVDAGRAYHRLVVVGASTVTGSRYDTYLTNSADYPTNSFDQALAIVAGGRYSPYGEKPNTYRVHFEVALNSNTRNRACEVYVEGYAVNANAGTALSYFPQQYTAHWEARP